MTGDARILVVDDVPQNVRLHEAILEPRGYDVVSASDGMVALEVVESAKPDLVLLDVMMPQLDGYAVCRRLRERDETAVLPVIMVTSSGTEKTKAIEAGRTISSRSRSATTSCSSGSVPSFGSSGTRTRSRRRPRSSSS